MNAMDPHVPVAIGRVGRDGRLLDAEPRLSDLNARAGGKQGEPLAVPQIASIARLALRLGIAISRNIVAAPSVNVSPSYDGGSSRRYTSCATPR